MRVRVDAILGDRGWEFGAFEKRTAKHVDVVVVERPRLGDVIEAPLAELIDPDSYTARRMVADDNFGGEAFLVVGYRMPPGRDT